MMNTTNLSKQTIDVILNGNTVYLETIEGAKGHVYYAPNGTAYMQHFEHGPLTGPWQFTETGYSVIWNKVGEIAWQLRHQDTQIVYLDQKGEKRARVLKLVSGDAEGLAA